MDAHELKREVLKTAARKVVAENPTRSIRGSGSTGGLLGDVKIGGNFLDTLGQVVGVAAKAAPLLMGLGKTGGSFLDSIPIVGSIASMIGLGRAKEEDLLEVIDMWKDHLRTKKEGFAYLSDLVRLHKKHKATPLKEVYEDVRAKRSTKKAPSQHALKVKQLMAEAKAEGKKLSLGEASKLVKAGEKKPRRSPRSKK